MILLQIYYTKEGVKMKNKQINRTLSLLLSVVMVLSLCPLIAKAEGTKPNIKIGDYTGVAYNSCFMDSNLHFTVNIESGMVKNKAGEVIVGKYNWIACGSIIRKGTVTKEYTIVASRSLLNKDYTKQEGEFQTLAGSPAKIIGTSHKRIFSRAIEASLIQYFKTENHSEKHLTPEEFQNASFL